jgi:hypothetical protein
MMRHFCTRIQRLEQWHAQQSTACSMAEWQARMASAREKIRKRLARVAPRDVTPEERREGMADLKRQLAERAGYRPSVLHMRRNGHAHS